MLKSWTFDRLRLVLLDQAVRLALKKRAPRRFPIDGTQDYRSCYFGGTNFAPPIFVVEEIGESHYNGKLYISDSTILRAKIKKRRAAHLNFYSRIDRPTASITYSNATRYLLEQIPYIPELRAFIQRLLIHLQARRVRFHRDRVDLLERLVDTEIERRTDSHWLAYNDGLSSSEWFTKLYGLIAFSKPEGEMKFEEFRILLDSLCDSGELKKNGTNYKICGKAMSTLSEYYVEERRNTATRNQNWILLALTAILAFSSIATLYLDYEHKRTSAEENEK